MHLRAPCCQQGLLARSTRHRTRAQITHKRPSAEYRRMTRLHRIHIDDASQTLGNGLHDRTRDWGGGRCTSLTGGQQQHRHAALDALLHHLTALSRKFHRGDDEAIGVQDERPFPPSCLTAGHHMKHL